MRSFNPLPYLLPHPRALSCSPPNSPHIERPRTKAQTAKPHVNHHNYHPSDQQQERKDGSTLMDMDPSVLQDLHLHLEQLYLQHCRQEQQEQTSDVVPVFGLLHPYCSSNIFQYLSLPLDYCGVDYNSSSSSNGQLPSHHHHATSAILVVDDITTLQGLVLYTLYLLHRLRFFRWRDTHRITLSYRRRTFTSLTATGVTSSSSLSVDTIQARGGETHVGAAGAFEQGSPNGILDETSDLEATVAVDRSTAIIEPLEGSAGELGGRGRGGTEPHTTRTKNEDMPPSLFKSPPSSSTLASSSSSSFSSSSSSSSSTSTSIASSSSSSSSSSNSSFFSSMSMLPYIFSSAPSATTTTPPHLPPPLFLASSAISPHPHPLPEIVTALAHPHSTSSSSSINNRLPPEILVQVFRLFMASHPRTLIRCTLVCRSWYKLVGPLVWKSPRVLWSQHWSRFHPITSLSSTTRASGGSASTSSAYAPSSSFAASSSTTAAVVTTTTATGTTAMAAVTAGVGVTTSVPRQSSSTLGLSNHGRTNSNDDNEIGSRDLVRDSLGGLDLVERRGESEGAGVGEGNPLPLQLQLQQILFQQAQQRQLAWLHLWQTDRAKALASERLHDQDRQELEQWLLWKKREKTRRLRELRRRRQDHAAAAALAASQAQSREGVDGQGFPYHRLQDNEGVNDLRGGTIRDATFRTHSRSSTNLPASSANTANGGPSRRSRGGRRRRMATTAPTTNMLTSDEDDDEDGDEDGSSDDSDSGDERGPVGIDSDDHGGVLSDSDYEASDDETPLMKLVSRFDALHAWISTSATAISAFQDVAAVPAFLSENSTGSVVLRDNQTLLHQEQHQQQHSQQQQQQQQQPPLQQQQQLTRLPFKGAIARIRRRQAAKECRRRLAEIRPWDGFPASLPLRTCGQWIQVINLQQEMPYQQRVMTQSFMQHPTPARERFGATARSRAIQILQQQQQQQQQQQGLADGGGRYGILGSVFRYLARQQPQGIPGGSVGASEPVRLLSRRDFVSDWTVKTILDHCPGLCRLTLSECHGITDRSLEFIGDSACVAARTLVSLHIAGCSQITDRGLLGLLGHASATAGTSTFSHRSPPFTSPPSPTSSTSCSSVRPFPTFISSNPPIPTSTTSLVRLESLDFAGCYQISDKGLIPLLKQCGSRLLQLRVSECDNITAASVKALATHCPSIQWLDLCRTGVLTEECLILLAERCTDLEWLNLARVSPQVEVEASNSSTLAGLDGAGDNSDENDTTVNAGAETEQDEEVEQEEVEADDDEKTLMTSTSTQFLTQSDNTNTNDSNDPNDQDPTLKQDSITDRALALLCESCPKLQLLDLSYISTISNSAMESLSESAKSLVCLTIIGCPGITSQSLLYLARLRNSSGKLGCITMGDALGISERDIEAIMQGTLSGWQKSLVDETNLGEILGRSWDE